MPGGDSTQWHCQQRQETSASEEQRLNSEQGLIQGVQQQWQKPHGLSSDPSLFSNKYTFFCQKHSLYLAASSLSFGSQALLVASLILSTWGPRVLLPCGTWNVSSLTRIEPTSHALEGFLTTGPSGQYPLVFECVEGRIWFQHTSSPTPCHLLGMMQGPGKTGGKTLRESFMAPLEVTYPTFQAHLLLKPKC